MLYEEDLRYFTETIRNSVISIVDALHKLEESFMTPAHMDTNTTEWNRLKFSAMRLNIRTNVHLKYSTYYTNVLSTYSQCETKLTVHISYSTTEL